MHYLVLNAAIGKNNVWIQTDKQTDIWNFSFMHVNACMKLLGVIHTCYAVIVTVTSLDLRHISVLDQSTYIFFLAWSVLQEIINIADSTTEHFTPCENLHRHIISNTLQVGAIDK